MARNRFDFPIGGAEVFYESHALFQDRTSRGHARLGVTAEASPVGSVFRHGKNQRAVRELQDRCATARFLCSVNLGQPRLTLFLRETDSLRQPS